MKGEPVEIEGLRRLLTPPRSPDARMTASARMVYWMAATVALVATASQLVAGSTLFFSVPDEEERAETSW